MIRIIVNGANGRMGIEVEKIAAGDDGIMVAALADISGDGVSCFRSLSDIPASTAADVIIDFSHHSAVNDVLSCAVSRNIPAVIATTGHTAEEKEKIREASDKIPVFYSANMSLGVAVLAKLAVTAASAFPEADIEIVETHHNRKKDSPSGTALMLAEAISRARPGSHICAESGTRGLRDPNEIGISSVRRGSITGIHEILISTDSQTLTLKHEAHSRTLFAEGAISAARFIAGKGPGLYGMSDLAGAADPD